MDYWTDEETAMLIELWPTQPARVIAERLGKTRNSIVGRVHRLNLLLSDYKKALLAAQTKPQPSRLRFKVRSRPALKIAPSDAPDSLRKSIIDLTCSECHFPDPEGNPQAGISHTFCGHPNATGSSYCEFHTFICTGEGTASERAAGRILIKIADREAA
jgi:hypothetical protein